ncbi:MAG: hypothetical protein C5B46_03405 [Proteobacteria bacterium]|nr:MAG: hypothetical protein C5B46_03405 [Pseudomonadota bacterium]
MQTLKNKTIFITGASRGIGRAIALKCARDGANIVVAAKTAESPPKLQGTIHSVAAEVEEAGGRALPLQVDIREDAAVEVAVRRTVQTFGGINALVNNASAISLSGTLATPLKRYDLTYAILTSDSQTTTGNFFVDEDVLKKAGVRDFDQYAVVPGRRLHTHIFLD